MKSTLHAEIKPTRLLKQLYTGEAPSGELLSMLERAVADWPYFATARLALLKATYPARSQKESPLVSDTAIRLPERSALFGILYPETEKLAELLSGELPSAGEEVITLIPEKAEAADQPLSSPPVSEQPEAENEESRQNLSDQQPAPQEIIERFLTAAPKIIPKEVVDYQADNETANQDNHPLVTETLAEIYANQGHSGKARQIYQILQLKFPEKSSYFADRIRELS